MKSERHFEFLVVIVLVTLTMAVSLPTLQAFGYRSWGLVLGTVCCIAAAHLLVVLLLNIENIRKWLKQKRERDR